MELVNIKESKSTTESKINITSDNIGETLSKELLDVLNGTVTKDNFMSAVVHGIHTVEKVKNMTGQEKKNAVITAASSLINNINVDESTRTFIQDMINNTLPDTIDWMVSFWNDMSQKKTCCFKFF